MRAMILAAGLGTRLRPITHAIPKPMVPVLGRPVMAHIIDLLRRNGFDELIANLHHFPDAVRDEFGDGAGSGVQLSYSFEDALLGTAGGVRQAAGFLGDSFLVISGDALTDIDLRAMRDAHDAHDGLATLAVKRVADTSQYGVVITGSDGRIQGFQEKPHPDEALSDLCNCGIYMFRAEVFEHFPGPGESKLAGAGDPPGFADWAMDVFPALLDADIPFYVHQFDRYWNDVGTLEEYRRSNFDALAGAVAIEPGAPQIEAGIYSGSDLGGVDMTAPVFVAEGCEVEEGVRLEGPVVVNAGARIGAGASLRESVVLPGAEVPADSILIDAIFGADQA